MIKERMSLMEAVLAMDEHQLVLPLFQRPFVWSEEQVCDLFDSLLQGYPLGGNLLLLETAPPDLQNRLQCCFFEPHNGKEAPQKHRNEVHIFEQLAGCLVLDGQQRLFAFYIGIRGSYIRGQQERAKLYFNLYPFLRAYFEKDLEPQVLCHHQFRFYNDAELEAQQNQIAGDLHRLEVSESVQCCDPKFFLLPLTQIWDWGRDRRTAKSEIRRILAPSASLLPKPLYEEFEDLLDSLHYHLWVNTPIISNNVAPKNSYDLLEIFSRLNQGSSFQARDLQYAIRIIFPTRVEQHTFSRHLDAQPSSDVLSGVEVHQDRVKENPSGGELNLLHPEYEEYEGAYERLLLIADELELSLDFLYHCYLFCEAGQVGELVANIRKREGSLALRNNGEHLLRFAEVMDTLRDAADSSSFIVKQWFQGNLNNNYVLLPVLYYFYKQAQEYMDPLNELQDIDLSRIVRWIALNEISLAVFRGGVPQLIKLLPVLYESISGAMNQNLQHFPLQQLQQSLGRVERSLALTDEAIENLLSNTKIKHRVCVPLIALLYSHPQRIALMQRYEERQIDFIQPQKLLTRRMLKSYNLVDEQVEEFFALRDSILNLQWLPKRLQTEKGDIPFRQWLSNSQQLQLLREQNQLQRNELVISFMRFHHVKAEDGIYTLNVFGSFLNERKTLLFQALKNYSQDFDDGDLQTEAPKLAYPAF